MLSGACAVVSVSLYSLATLALGVCLEVMRMGQMVCETASKLYTLFRLLEVVLLSILLSRLHTQES